MTTFRGGHILLVGIASVAARVHVDFAVLRLGTNLPRGSFLEVWGASGTVGWTALRALRQGLVVGGGMLLAVADVGLIRQGTLTLVLGIVSGAAELVFLSNVDSQMFSTGRLAFAEGLAVIGGIGTMILVVIARHSFALMQWIKDDDKAISHTGRPAG